ncbi:MAG: AsmA-like C-terminal region-containing protein [Planctomycetaceae bacterium]|nr:AsmA-like C-terminal region-containing protein [Planctomycetaceae bacterium]
MGILRLIGIGLCWGTLLAIIGAAVACLAVYSQMNNTVQKYVLAELKERYPNLDVRIGSAQIIENRGISIKNIEFSTPYLLGPPRPLLRIGEMFIECPVTLQSLYQQNLQISRITIKNPILRATLSQNGTFCELDLLANDDDYAFLFPDDADPVLVEIENGTLLYDDARRPGPPLHFSNINLAVTPEIRSRTRYIPIKGSVEGDFFRRILVEAELQADTKHWHISANCRQLDWTDDLWQYIPPHPHFKERPLFQGRFDFNFRAFSDPAAELGFRFAVSGALAHGRADFPNINRTLTELSTRFEISSERIVIDKLTGNGDFARLAASYTQEGFSFFGNPHQQAELTVSLLDCRFDEQLAKALSPFFNKETNRLIDQFDFDGTADLYAQLACRNGVWYPKNVTMKISDIGFSYHEFPYRVDRLSGNLYIYENALMRFNLKSKQDSPHNTVIDGHYYNIYEDIAGRLEVFGDHVPIDQKLIRAFQPKTQEIANSLHPSGKLHAKLVFTLPPGNLPVNKRFDIALDNVSLRYDLFPYPLRDVKGLVHYDGNVWQFYEMLGSNGLAMIRGRGFLRPVASDSQEFVLSLLAEDLPIDEQIMQALIQPGQRQMLQSLNINGKVHLAAQIQYRTDLKHLDLKFQTAPQPGLSIYPDQFPYKIENIAGEIHYENGRIFSAIPLSGTHRDTRLRSEFDCRFSPNGQFELSLNPMTAEHLHANKELLDALPNPLRGFLESIQLTRPFDLSGGIEYRQSMQGQQSVDWDLNWFLRQNSVHLGVPVEDICGNIRLTGRAANEHVQLQGELHLDSLAVSGFEATAIRGPFSFDGNQLRLGVHDNHLAPNVVARPLTAQFYDGTMRAKGLVIAGSDVSYHILADLHGADLAKVANVVRPTQQKTEGTLNCVNVVLRGVGASRDMLEGTGTIQLRDANIYGAPVIVRLLRELRIRESDPNAGMFSTVDVGFRIARSNIHLDPVVLEGGAISLRGDGVVRLDNQQLDLTMKTRLGNRRVPIPVISEILGGVGDQLVQLKIAGSIGDPVVSRVAIPEVQKALMPTQSEDSPPAASQNRPPRVFPWRPL